jgi:cytidyltransferase-like protein
MSGERPPVVYVDGVFDLFHPGHLSFLRKAKAAGGAGARLVAGVISDEDAAWKRKPIMTFEERRAMLEACSVVDAVVLGPLIVTVAFMDSNGFDLAVHGDDDPQEAFFGELIKAGRMLYVPYTPGVSTSEILKRAATRQDGAA